MVITANYDERLKSLFSMFPFWLSGKESCLPSRRDAGSIPGSGRFPREGNGNPLQYSCLGNSMTEEPRGLQSMGSQRDTT